MTGKEASIHPYAHGWVTSWWLKRWHSKLHCSSEWVCEGEGEAIKRERERGLWSMVSQLWTTQSPCPRSWGCLLQSLIMWYTARLDKGRSMLSLTSQFSYRLLRLDYTCCTNEYIWLGECIPTTMYAILIESICHVFTRRCLTSMLHQRHPSINGRREIQLNANGQIQCVLLSGGSFKLVTCSAILHGKLVTETREETQPYRLSI